MVHLFLSPHLDDIGLSCAGLAGRLARQGDRVIMATFCTADYEGPFALSPAAKHEHWQWQLGERPYRHRRAEDRQAADLLGAEALHLGLLATMTPASPCTRAGSSWEGMSIPMTGITSTRA